MFNILRLWTIFCFFDHTVWLNNLGQVISTSLLFEQNSKAIVFVHGQGGKTVTKTSREEII